MNNNNKNDSHQTIIKMKQNKYKTYIYNKNIYIK